jgi:hypothetical protein
VTAHEVHVNVRCTKAFRDRIDEAAHRMGMNRSEWVLHVCEDAIWYQFADRSTAARPAPRSRTLAAGRNNPALCSHPVALRSAVGPDGTSRCMACNETVRPL